MRWTTIAPPLLACVLAAPLAAQSPARGDQTAAGMEIELYRMDAPAIASFGLPPARLWPLALLAYSRVGLRVDTTAPPIRQAATRAQPMWHQLKGSLLSHYFECGHIFTGPVADTWRLRVDARMAVLPGTTSDSSKLALTLVATATPIDGSGSTATPCNSRGKLEEAITAEVRRIMPQ